MTAWYSVATPAEVERLDGAWRGAPTENAELCGFLLEVAREQVVAYAPESEPVEVTPLPAPATLPLQGSSLAGSITYTRLVGGIVRADIHVTNEGDQPTAAGWESAATVGEVPADLRPAVSADTGPYGGFRVVLGDNDSVAVYAASLEPGASLNVTIVAMTATPDPDPVEDVPARYAYAQLRQAKTLWAAGTADQDGNIGAEGYSYVPRPLDKTIRQIIRPTTGAASVF